MNFFFIKKLIFFLTKNTRFISSGKFHNQNRYYFFFDISLFHEIIITPCIAKISPIERNVWSGSAIWSLINIFFYKYSRQSMDRRPEFAVFTFCIVFCPPAVDCLFFLPTQTHIKLCQPLWSLVVSFNLSGFIPESFRSCLQISLKCRTGCLAGWSPIFIEHDILLYETILQYSIYVLTIAVNADRGEGVFSENQLALVQWNWWPCLPKRSIDDLVIPSDPLRWKLSW